MSPVSLSRITAPGCFVVKATVRDRPGMRSFRIGVIESNAQAFPFWHKMGFLENGERYRLLKNVARTARCKARGAQRPRHINWIGEEASTAQRRSSFSTACYRRDEFIADVIILEKPLP